MEGQPDTPLQAHGDFARFVMLLWNTALMVDRCFEELEDSPATARETFGHLVGRVSTIRNDFDGLSPVEQTAVRHNIDALAEHARDLHRLLESHGEPAGAVNA